MHLDPMRRNSNSDDQEKHEFAIRLATFRWLAEQVAIHGDVLPRSILQNGFMFEQQRIPLVAPQGIFKPRMMTLPLSIATTPRGPYQDSFSHDFLIYRYRGTDPNHPDNQGLRRLMELNLPLVYLHGILPGKYMAVWPVYVVGDDRNSLSFRVAVDDTACLREPMQIKEGAVAVGRRAYITSRVRVRLHQRSFRERVIAAYHAQCSFCNLKHQELLDAAHIIPDSEPLGEPDVPNGIALCKLHHAAFDSLIIGVAPDYVIHVRQDIREEKDGPILKHGLQALHRARLSLPASKLEWPSQEALEIRFERFQSAA